MLPKRHFNETRENRLGVLFQGSKRRRTFKNVVLEVMKGLSVNEIATRLEPLFRVVVREEVERVLLPYFLQFERPQMNQTGTSRARGLRLRFVNRLPRQIYTESRLEAEDRSPVQIEVVDASTNTRVVSGPWSSIRIELVVVDGDFGKDGQETWSGQEFNSKVLRQREGKRPLLTGDSFVTLKEGLGCIGDVAFTDNSCWMRNRKFRLGARIVQTISGEVEITQGRSDAFVVKDHRGKACEKHYPPAPKDEIWRLEKISKGGVLQKRLNSHHIYTVEDFVQLYLTNPTELRWMLGGRTSTKQWDIITKHALSCASEEAYTYFGAEHKLLIEDLKRQNYGNVNALVGFDEQATAGPSEILTKPQDGLDVKHTNFPVTDQVIRTYQSETQLSNDQSSASTSHTYEANSSQQPQPSVSQNYHPIDPFAPEFRNSFRVEEFFHMINDKDNVWLPGGSVVEDVTLPHIPATWSPSIASWGQGNGLFLPVTNESDISFFPTYLPNIGVQNSTNKKPGAGWFKIRVAFKMRSVWRCVRYQKNY